MGTIFKTTTVQGALVELLSHKDALIFDETLTYATEATGIEINNLSDIPVWQLAGLLCGSANRELAMDFMNGSLHVEEAFLDNVKYNSSISIPLIIRAINIRMSH